LFKQEVSLLRNSPLDSSAIREHITALTSTLTYFSQTMPAKPKAPAVVVSNVWAFVGTDELKVKEAALRLTRQLVPPEAGDFGMEVVDGMADNVDHAERILYRVLEDLQTGAFFGGDKVVWLKSASFLADNVTGRSPRVLEGLEKLGKLLTDGLPSDTKFILTATDVDKRRSFYNILKKATNLEIFDVIDTSKQGWEEQVMRLVEDRAEEYNMRFEPAALELFVMLAGEHTQQIENELAKLDLYVGKERAVAPEDVRLIVSQTKNGIIWDLGDAIGARQLPRALKVLDQLLHQGENAIGILLAAIVPRVRNLFQARELAESYGVKFVPNYNDYLRNLDRLPEEIRSALPMKKDGSGLNAFPLFSAAREMGKYSAVELRGALEECLKANRRLVTSALDHDVVLSQLLMRILSAPARRPAPKPPAKAAR
jgi:DNA polymerase III subunit delta